MTRLVVLLACALIATAAVACRPTGDPRCDRHAGILVEIQAHGWTTDCKPDFPNKGGAGQTIWGWADRSTKTVYAWPDEISTDRHLRKTLWHELAHVRGITDETDADRYAYCREPMDGVGYRFATFPTETDCKRLGARTG